MDLSIRKAGKDTVRGVMQDEARIISQNLQFYDQIKPKNHNQTYTVIATLNDVRTTQLIALATGTQASLAVYEDDIEDCHAESLVKRAYKRYLIDAALDLAKSKSASGPQLFSEFRRDYGEQELMMFVSQFPCGLIRRYEGQEPVNEESDSVIKRKPGRGVIRDGKTVYVQRDPCLSKLKRWSSTYGIQGKSWHQIFGVRSAITHFVVGNCEPSLDLDYPKHLDDLAKELSSEAMSTIQFDMMTMRRDEFVFATGKQPEPVALIWWASRVEKPCHNIEYVVDGRRRGLTKNQCKSTCDQFKLKSGDYLLRSELNKVHEVFM